MDPTLSWTLRLFRQHYRTRQVFLPPRFTRREYGFMFHGESGMQRHLGFGSGPELVKYLVERGPAHCYYSTAYYTRPEAIAMKDKGWLGADLIFDLDADHLPDAKAMTFDQQLQTVRDEALHVVEEFLLRHFGFSASDIRIAFSGGRGYHIHVTHEDVIPLEADARREIVAYVTGNGLHVEGLVRRRAVRKKVVAGHEGYDERLELPAPDEPGWRGLAGRALDDEFRRLATMDEKAAAAELEAYDGVGPKRAAEAVSALRSGARPTDVASRLPLAFTRTLLQRAAVRAAGEADEPVTADVKRLIRLPGTLHGKTGLAVTPVALSHLHEFDPLVEAVALPDDEVTVQLTKPADLRIGGSAWKLDAGLAKLPTYAAAYLVLRRQAVVPGASP